MKTHNSGPVPSVIRSRQHLAAQGVQLTAPGVTAPTSLPITPEGVTYSMAQEAAWIDVQHFAVGHWDGSLSIFGFTPSPTVGPMITKAVNTPSFEGVQMITWLAPGVFCSSNDDGSIAVWSSASRTWMDLQQSTTLQYDPAWGVANSADSLATGSKLFLVAGHANGFVSLWSGNLDGTGLKLLRGVDVRNPNPTNPWGLHNIRGVSVILWTNTNGYIVTGSEDGYLCVLQLPDGAILSQTVYNLGAQRGINSVAAFGQNLLVSNCSVGPNDNNLWYYWIDGSKWSVTLKDGTNLRVNPEAPQVFNFCTIWGWSNNQPCFFASTEEGALWMGRITPSQRLSVLGYETVYGNLGSALAFNANGELVVVNYNLYEFSTQIKPSIEPSQNPERLPLSLWPPLMENRR